VWKVSARAEPLFIREHPDIFVPVLEMIGGNPCAFKMPLYEEPDIYHDREIALMGGLQKLKELWLETSSKKTAWKTNLRSHLYSQVLEYKLDISPTLINEIISALPECDTPKQIHGDATLANLIYNEGQWFWIDPLQRPFIPGDPHVDLGKMLQSCWDYEKVLLGEDSPGFDRDLAKKLATSAQLEFYAAWNWCVIHIIRLLPYQDRRVRGIYERVLNSL